VALEILPGFLPPCLHEMALSLGHPEENSTLGGTLLVLQSNGSFSG
jgi:hypothetical protein